MLSVSKPLSPERAAWYFNRDNYYLAQEGEWYGKLSSELNLSGPIQREDFLKLLEGYDQNGSKLVASAGAKDIKDDQGNVKKHGHRSGIDLTFSAPKSVSILSYQDPEINTAFRKAVKTTLNHIESEFAHTQRKVKRGVVHAEKTSELLWSTFVHDTSRELDPQLHCHCVLMNLTRDKEGKLKTLHNDPLYKNKMYIGQHFRNQLAEEIKKIGYAIEVTDRKKGFFEIRGVGEDVIQAFSKRSQQVRAELKKLRELQFRDLPGEHLRMWAKERKKEYLNTPEYEQVVEQELNRLSGSSEKVYASYSDAKLAAIATTNSRIAKRDVSREYVTEIIESTCNSLSTSLEEMQKTAQNIPRESKYQVTAGEILRDAVTGLTEGQSTFTSYNLITEALKMGIGIYTYEDFEREFRRMIEEGSISLLGSLETKAGKKEVYSSREMIRVESSIIDICREFKGVSKINVEKRIADEIISRTDINLKMKTALEIDEKDLIKADYKFKAVLSKIEDKDIREKLVSLREKVVSARNDASLPAIDANDYPDLHKYFEKFGYGFTPGQKDALKLIASTRDIFSVIQGDAGTGKSFSVLYAKQLLEQNGFIVKGFAPTGKATTGLAVSAEIFESNYSTIDSFLLKLKNCDPEKRKEMYVKGKEVWVVDEAGMCGSRKFLDLMNAAREAEAKVVFIGDRKQFQSIEAGRMFSELQDKAGIDQVIMPDVMRQKTSQTKEIVKAISLKDMDFAFNIMQGYRKVSESFDKTELSNYNTGSSIQFASGYAGLPEETQCKVKGVGESLLLEYFDEDSRVFKEMKFDPSRVDPLVFDVYQPPLNHHALSKYNKCDKIRLSLPEQGLPATTLEIAAISESSLVVTYSDPQTGNQRKVSFDPTKNPENITHLSRSGNEKLSSSKDYYENMITAEPDNKKCLNLVAQDYLESVSAKKDVLLITGTNHDKDALNDLIRPELVKQGIIADTRAFNVFQTKSLSGTAAMAADSYKPGQVIITNDKCGVIPKGTQAEIQSIDRTSNTISVRYWDKKKEIYVTADIDARIHCKKFSTYDQQSREFGVGDLIIFLKNDKRVIGVNNGDTARILSIDQDGNVRACLESSESKKEVTFNLNNRGPRAYNYISHAYAITDYKSQGATTSRLLWYAPTSGGPISSNTFYVAITRCKEEVGVYTDNVDELREMVKHEQQKESVLDYPVKLGSSANRSNKNRHRRPVESIKELYHNLFGTIFCPKEGRLSQKKEKEAVLIDR